MIRFATISPCYNESLVLDNSAARLDTLFCELIANKKISPDSRILYVNDGSTDNTWDVICRLHQQYPRVCGINLAHNVGHQNAIMAGMMTMRNRMDAVVTIDADLQDDLAAIEHMIDAHIDGAEVVFGVKTSRNSDPWIKKTSAQIFYKLLSAMGVQTVYNHADFRLMSRKALEALASFPERNLYLRGLIPLVGLKTALVDDVLSPRQAGESKYTLRKMLRLASDGITSFSTRPIELILSVGFFMLTIALGMFCYVITSIMMQHYAPGWASLMMSLWFIGAVVTLSIGIIGTYIGKIYIEVKHRPLYIIDEELGLEQ